MRVCAISLLRVLVCLMLAGPVLAEPQHYEVIVYGGTAGGVMAGYAAAEQGADVLIIEPGELLGGLVSSGLGATDAGRTATIGGYARQFFERVGEHYGRDIAWQHEPHAVERVFHELADEAGIELVFNQRLDLDVGVLMDGRRIAELVMETGERYSATIFIDATYEGDLLALAGVSYHVGREGRDAYGERYAGVRPAMGRSAPGMAYDEHGLLPDIHTGEIGEVGEADDRVQAYNFRLCLTTDPDNRVAIEKPDEYDPRRYTLLARAIKQDPELTFDRLVSITELPDGKTDVNNNGPLSTDLTNGSWDYPLADYETRERIWRDHRNYIQGLLYFLAHDERVPESIRSEAGQWGLAADEFVESDHWPPLLYVRQARRMVGEHVMTEHDLLGDNTQSDSIGMGSYMMDVHYVQRTLTDDGGYIVEGPLGASSILPYEISYASLVPQRDEVTNLLVPVCISASHVAWSSIRMEPVFMLMGHSAGVAASIALEHDIPVQDVPYDELREKLLAQGQVLSYQVGGQIDPADLDGFVIDDGDAELRGNWSRSNSGDPFVGQGYRHDNNFAKGDRRAVYRFAPPHAGTWEVRLYYAPDSNRASNVPVTVVHSDGEQTHVVDQRQVPEGRLPYLVLGRYAFDPETGGELRVTNANTDGFVVIDAVQFVPVQEPGMGSEP